MSTTQVIVSLNQWLLLTGQLDLAVNHFPVSTTIDLNLAFLGALLHIEHSLLFCLQHILCLQNTTCLQNL